MGVEALRIKSLPISAEPIDEIVQTLVVKPVSVNKGATIYQSGRAIETPEKETGEIAQKTEAQKQETDRSFIDTLSPTERRVYEYFRANSGRTITTDELIASCWESKPDVTDSNLVESVLYRLRKKLPADEAELLETRRGLGYEYCGQNEKNSQRKRTVRIGEKLINFDTGVITGAKEDGMIGNLTSTQLAALQMLYQTPAEAVSTQQIATIFDTDSNMDSDINSENVRVIVSRLREKLGDKEKKLIRTERGRGYKVEPYTELENRILRYLNENPFRVITPEELALHCWGNLDVNKTTITNAISRLRRKSAPTVAESINPIYARGYKFNDLNNIEANNQRFTAIGEREVDFDTGEVRIVGQNKIISRLPPMQLRILKQMYDSQSLVITKDTLRNRQVDPLGNIDNTGDNEVTMQMRMSRLRKGLQDDEKRTVETKPFVGYKLRADIPGQNQSPASDNLPTYTARVFEAATHAAKPEPAPAASFDPETVFTKKEHQLYAFLKEKIGNIATSDEIIQHVWAGAATNETIKVTLKRMLDKMRTHNPDEVTRLETIKGQGLRYNDATQEIDPRLESLSHAERNLYRYLSANAGVPIRSDIIFKELWGEEFDPVTLRANWNRMLKKIEKVSPELAGRFQNIHGVGYVFDFKEENSE